MTKHFQNIRNIQGSRDSSDQTREQGSRDDKDDNEKPGASKDQLDEVSLDNTKLLKTMWTNS